MFDKNKIPKQPFVDLSNQRKLIIDRYIQEKDFSKINQIFDQFPDVFQTLGPQYLKNAIEIKNWVFVKIIMDQATKNRVTLPEKELKELKENKDWEGFKSKNPAKKGP